MFFRDPDPKEQNSKTTENPQLINFFTLLPPESAILAPSSEVDQLILLISHNAEGTQQRRDTRRQTGSSQSKETNDI